LDANELMMQPGAGLAHQGVTRFIG